MKKILFFWVIAGSLLFSSSIYAQEGEVVQSDFLPDEWEYYQFDFSNDLVISLPVLKDRTDFLAQKLQLESEEDKFILRFTYNYKNQLYLFLIATRGIIPGIEEKRDEGLRAIIDEQIGGVYSTIAADGFAGLSGQQQSFTDVTSDMSELESAPRYFINNSELIYFVCQGYQKKALRKGQDNSTEVKANVGIMTKNVSWKSD